MALHSYVCRIYGRALTSSFIENSSGYSQGLLRGGGGGGDGKGVGGGGGGAEAVGGPRPTIGGDCTPPSPGHFLLYPPSQKFSPIYPALYSALYSPVAL